MKIHMDNSIYLESDDRQFMLRKYSGATDKNGNEIYSTLGYFGSISQAVRFLVKKRLLESDATTLKHLVKDIEKIENRIDEILGYFEK